MSGAHPLAHIHVVAATLAVVALGGCGVAGRAVAVGVVEIVAEVLHECDFLGEILCGF